MPSTIDKDQRLSYNGKVFDSQGEQIRATILLKGLQPNRETPNKNRGKRFAAEFRTPISGLAQTRLFLPWIGKHVTVTSSTIARWLWTCLLEAGIDTSVFKAHSVRGAACSTAAWAGVTTPDILKAADWSSEGT